MPIFIQFLLELLKVIPWETLSPELRAVTALAILLAAMRLGTRLTTRERRAPRADRGSVVIYDRRVGPADRRALAGGGRRRTDRVSRAGQLAA